MQNEDRRFLLMGAGLLGMGVAGAVAAGSLNPPPGPVTPTGKPLQDIEPRIAVQGLAGDGTALFVISQPGSYYLTGNIAGVSGKDGVRITASDVTLDLRGFAITGPGSGSGLGINQSSGTRARIVNGFVGNCPSGAVSLGAASVVSDVVARNGAFGISVGAQSRVERCSVQSASIGIQSAGNGTVQGCRVDLPGSTGISAGTGTRISQCEVNGGVTGILATNSPGGIGSIVRDCVVQSAGTDGINVAATGSVVEGCTVNFCSNGIRITGGQSRVALNQISQCSNGIIVSASAPGLVVQNTIYGASMALNLAASVQVGPIVSAAGTIPVNTSPWANFTS